MTDTQVAVDLRECGEPHQVLHHVLVPEEDAGRYIEAWSTLGSTRAGRTEVVTHTLTHPHRRDTWPAPSYQETGDGA